MSRWPLSFYRPAYWIVLAGVMVASFFLTLWVGTWALVVLVVGLSYGVGFELREQRRVSHLAISPQRHEGVVAALDRAREQQEGAVA